jgi:hypothetical protein
MTLRFRRLSWGLLAVAALTLSAAGFLSLSPSFLYRLTGSQRQFNLAVSQSVLKGATLAQLENVVGPGQKVSIPPWLRQMIERQPGAYPDGWTEGDTCVSYSFPGNSTWYFQVRDGRLVNYDPAVLAGQPQEQIRFR